MNKRVFDEISDDEWEHHTFKPSRFLKNSNGSPPLESFAFRKNVINLDDDGDNEEEEGAGVAQAMQGTRGRRLSVDDDPDVEIVKPKEQEDEEDEEDEFNFSLSDDDLEDVGGEDVEQEEEAAVVRAQQGSRGRRFIVEDDSDVDVVKKKEQDDEEEFNFGLSDDESEAFEGDTLEEEGEDEKDLVGKVLHKCANISASLRRELYGSAGQECERYAEVETSAARIVTQEDINMACKSEESDFDPVLKPYQIVGVNFLMLLYRKNIGGAILADEMGLGKTVQAVTYLTLLKQLDNDPGPHLIVCPASVLENWERELKRWCPTFSVVMFHGVGRTVYSKELSLLGKAGLPPPFNVLLTSYTLFERRSGQQKDDRKVLKRWQWSCVLLDEAHVLKDKGSFRWKNLMSVAKNARQRLMLTGTPLQNDLHELWSLLEFMMPDIFAAGNADSKMLLNAEGEDLIIRIKSILGPFILRRLKSDVMQQLVPKIQRVEYVGMESEQADTYKETIDKYRAVSQGRMERYSRRRANTCAVLSKSQISNYFMQFRKVANHPLLVRRIYNNEHVACIAKFLYPKGVFGFECSIDRVIQELEGYNDYQLHRLLISYGDAEIELLEDKHVLCSAKCQALARLLPTLKRNGHRVLIFSQWTSMLDILEWALDVIGVTYKRLDGSTQVTERQTIVDTFNNNPSIFACLLSTRAGGQGLNLIGADTVIIHDMDFNPQMDRQAEDRCHRIGQVKPVTVYRLVTKGTVDENIYEIAKRKLVLDAAVLESSAEPDNGNDVPEKTMGEILSSLLLF